jgi:hypothetical protein
MDSHVSRTGSDVSFTILKCQCSRFYIYDDAAAGLFMSSVVQAARSWCCQIIGSGIYAQILASLSQKKSGSAWSLPQVR